MRTKILLIFTGFFAFYLFMIARSGGLANISNQDRTGSPFSTSSSCGSCHNGASFNPSITFNLLDQTNSPVTSYIPGDDYIIEYNLTNGSGNPAGFGLQSIGLLSNNQTAGTLGTTITSNTRISNIGARQYIEHNGVNAAGNFRVNWTAPSAGSGNITFYYTGIVANGNGGTSGDQGVPKTTSIITEGCLAPMADFGFSVNGAVADFSDLTTNSPATWLWDFGDGNTSTQQNPNHTYQNPGTYTVCLTSSTCVSDSICRTVNIICPPSLNISVVTQSNISCAGDSTGAVTVGPLAGNAPFSYAWSNNDTSQSQLGLPAGAYQVIVTDANACTDSLEVQVIEPQPLALAFSSLDIGCSGDSTGAATAIASGGTSPYNYSWSNGSIDSAQVNLPAGLYTVYVADVNACSDSLDVQITQPSDISISVGFNSINCFGDSTGSALALVIGGTPGFTYEWSSGDTVANPTNLLAGVYSVTVKDANGCPATDSITITQNPKIEIDFSEIATACYGDSNGAVSVLVSGGITPYALNWSTGDTISTLDQLASGNYLLTVSDSLGCVASDTAGIAQPDSFILDFQVVNETNGMDGSIDLGITGGTPPYAFSWSNGDSTEDLSSLIAGTYTVSIRDQNGCQITDSVIVDATLSLENGLNTNTFTLFPNPSQGRFSIRWESNPVRAVNLCVWDLQGKLVYENREVTNQTVINLPRAKSGLYLVELERNGEKAYQKLVIDHN
jgi:PKD repeat protein